MDLVRPGFLTSLCLSLQLFLYLGTTCHNEGTVRDKISSLDVVQQLRLETLSLRFSAPLLGQPCKQLGSRSARGPSHNLPFLLLFLAILRLSTVHFQKPSLPWGGVSEEVVCSQPLQSWPPNQGLAMLAGGGPLERWAPGPSACILAVSTPAACARAHGSAPAGATTGGGGGGQLAQASASSGSCCGLWTWMGWPLEAEVFMVSSPDLAASCISASVPLW